MSKKNIIIMLFFAIFILNSCSRNNDIESSDGLPYYQFTLDEKSKLIDKPNVGTVITYKNQDNELLKFKIFDSEIGKTTFATGTFWGSYTTQHFHYDRQKISMWYAEGYTYSICEINILKYPIGSNYQTQYPTVGTPRFYGYFTFPLWNGYNGTDEYNNSISIDFDKPTITMSFNGKTYTKVRIFESNKNIVLATTNTFPFYPKNVNIIYYDDNTGIIGFDDLNGKLWRIQ
jgi:hypothetical protein